MNKKLLIVVVVVLLLATGYYLMKGKTSGIPGVGSTETSSGPKSLKELIAAGIAQKCTFSSTDESGSTEGTTYVAGGKMRGDFTNVISGKTTKSHMIVDGKTNYIWTDGEKTGFKVTVEDTSGAGDTSVSQDTTQGSMDLNEKADYKCSSWVTDSSQFTPPSNVQFTDFSQMFNPSALPAAY